MEFSVKSGNPEKQRTACLIIGVSQPRKLSRAGKQIDQLSNGQLSTIIRRGDMDGKLGQTLVLHHVPGCLADRVMLVGLGKDKDMNERNFRKVLDAVYDAQSNIGAMEAYSYLTDTHVKGRDLSWKIRQTVLSMEGKRYHFDRLKSKKEDPPKSLRKLVMNVPSRRDLGAGEKAIKQGMAISSGMSLTRDLGNLPGNICTPGYLADEARRLQKTFPAMLSVAAGSEQPAKLITMEYHGGDSVDKPGRHRPQYREPARRQGHQARRHRHQHVRPDHRDPQYRCRGATDPLRRPQLCRKIRSRCGHRHRDPHRRLSHRPGPQSLRRAR